MLSSYYSSCNREGMWCWESMEARMEEDASSISWLWSIHGHQWIQSFLFGSPLLLVQWVRVVCTTMGYDMGSFSAMSFEIKWPVSVSHKNYAANVGWINVRVVSKNFKTGRVAELYLWAKEASSPLVWCFGIMWSVWVVFSFTKMLCSFLRFRVGTSTLMKYHVYLETHMQQQMLLRFFGKLKGQSCLLVDCLKGFSHKVHIKYVTFFMHENLSHNFACTCIIHMPFLLVARNLCHIFCNRPKVWCHWCFVFIA